jgi:hypothetical protein
MACCSSAHQRDCTGVSRLETREAGKIEIDGTSVRVSRHKSLPLPVFILLMRPRCLSPYNVCGVWACRKCHKLDYARRRCNRTIPVCYSVPHESGGRVVARLRL